MFEKGLVSIIIPSFNRYDLLLHSIRSCIQQTYSHIEIIVVNDCSTDPRYRSGELEKLPKTKVLHLEINKRELHKTNAAQGMTRQEGVNVARGEWIAFLDDDDFFLPDKLEIQLLHLKKNDGLFCSTNMFMIQHQSISCDKLDFVITRLYFDREIPARLTKHMIDQENFINNSTVIIHSSIMQSFLPEKYEDWELWKRILQHVDCCHYIPQPLVYYTINMEKHYSTI